MRYSFYPGKKFILSDLGKENPIEVATELEKALNIPFINIFNLCIPSFNSILKKTNFSSSRNKEKKKHVKTHG